MDTFPLSFVVYGWRLYGVWGFLHQTYQQTFNVNVHSSFIAETVLDVSFLKWVLSLGLQNYHF